VCWIAHVGGIAEAIEDSGWHLFEIVERDRHRIG
jgi:hypothetical protein